MSSLPATFYDELLKPDGTPRPGCEHVAEWLAHNKPADIATLNQQALAMFHRKGVTFTVYSEASNIERVIPFDIIPRIIPNQEWQILEAGCAQRIRALNMFIHDLYHEQHIIKAGIVPAKQVLVNECYQPWMHDIRLPHPIYAHISGIDLIRHGDGNYYVLEDNLRTPSGVSYMMEGRNISESLLPELFHQQKVRSISDYPALLKENLIACSGKDEPNIVVLTPGRYNSAYYEHAFLAREMSVPLVHGYDVFVEDNFVYVKTVTGRMRVDVIYRRLDDPFLDPLAFRADSILGIPGLMAAYRAGKVLICNAPGTGVAGQIGLSVRRRHDPLLSLRRTHPAQCADLPMPQRRRTQLCFGASGRIGGQGNTRLGRLRHVGRPQIQPAGNRRLPPAHSGQSGRLYRPADAGVVYLPNLRRRRHYSAPHRPASVRPQRPRQSPHRTGRPDTRRAARRLAGRQLLTRRRRKRYLGC